MPNVRSYSREARNHSRCRRAVVGRWVHRRFFPSLGRLSGLQGRRSRVSPPVGGPPGGFAKNLFLQKCPCTNWRIAQSLWGWSACAVVADFLDCGPAFVEGAPQRIEAGAIRLEDRGPSPKGQFRSLEIELRAITRRAPRAEPRAAPSARCRRLHWKAVPSTGQLQRGLSAASPRSLFFPEMRGRIAA
jgi:hypothetical protein